MGDGILPAAFALAAGIVSCLATRALIPILRRRQLLDQPNERSSHQVPTPRGGGIAVIGSVLLAWLVLLQAGLVPPVFSIIALAAGLALLG